MRKLGVLTVVAAMGMVSSAGAWGGFDFGSWRDGQLRAFARHLFGVDRPLKESSHESVDAATAEADPRTLATVARGLHVHVATSAPNAGANLDMIALWPNNVQPTHLIVCNEVTSPTEPGVQRIRLSDGAVETILRGTNECDPVRRTPWGTILVGEENGTSGQVIEIISPLATTEVAFDDVTGTASGGTGAANVVSRRALGRLSFEGMAALSERRDLLRRREPASHRNGGRGLLQVHTHDPVAGRRHHEPQSIAARRRHDLRPAARQAQREHRLRPGHQHRTRGLGADSRARRSVRGPEPEGAGRELEADWLLSARGHRHRPPGTR